MTRFVMRVPDLGEGSVSAEVIAWKVAAGDTVREDAPLVELSTDKAVVEVPSPVSGVVVAVSGKPGDTLAVGSELAVFEVEGAAAGVDSVKMGSKAIGLARDSRTLRIRSQAAS